MCCRRGPLELPEDGLGLIYGDLGHRDLGTSDSHQDLRETVELHSRCLIDADALEFLAGNQPCASVKEPTAGHDGLSVYGPALLSPVQPGRGQG